MYSTMCLYQLWTHGYLFYSVEYNPSFSWFSFLLKLSQICPYKTPSVGPCALSACHYPFFFFEHFLNCLPPWESWASFVAQMVKNLPAMLETQVWFLRWKDPLQKGMATQKNSMDREAWQVTVHGVAESDMIELLTLSLSEEVPGSSCTCRVAEWHLPFLQGSPVPFIEDVILAPRSGF